MCDWCAVFRVAFGLVWLIEEVGMFLCLWMEMQMEDGRG